MMRRWRPKQAAPNLLVSRSTAATHRRRTAIEFERVVEIGAAPVQTGRTERRPQR
jgi:hypothetical protein